MKLEGKKTKFMATYCNVRHCARLWNTTDGSIMLGCNLFLTGFKSTEYVAPQKTYLENLNIELYLKNLT